MHSEHTGLEDAQLSSQRLGTIKSLALDATAFTAMLQKHARQEELEDEMGEERSGAYSTLNSARSSNRSMSPPPPQSTPSKNVANGRKPLTQSGAEVAVAVHPLAFGALREAKRGVKSHQTKSSLGSHAGGASSQHARPPLAHGAGGTHPASRTVSPHPPVLNAEKKNTGTSLTPMIPSIASDPTEVECEIGDVPPISQVCLVRAPHRRTEEDSSGCVSNMWLEDILRALPNDVSALHELVRALVKTIRNLEASHATRALHHASYVLDLAQDSAPKQGLPPGGGTILPEPLYHKAHNRRNPSDPRSCPFGVLEKEKAQKNRVVGRKSTSVVPPNLSVKAKSQRVANTTSPLKKRRVDSVDNVAQSRVSNGGTMTHSRTPTRNVPLTPTANRATSPATSTRSSASSSAGGECIRAGGRHVIITSAEASPSTMAPMRSTNSPLFTPTVVPPLAMLPSGTSVDARGSPSSKEQSQRSSNSSGRVYTTSSKGQRSSSGRSGAPSAPDPTRFLLRGGGIRNQRIVSACGTDREGRNQGGGTHRSVTQNSNGVQQQPIPRSPHLSTIAPPKSYLSDTMAQNSTLSGRSPTVHHITTVTRHYGVSSPLLSGRVAPCEESGVRSGRTTPSSRSSKQTSVVRVNTSVQAAARISPVTKRIITSSNRPSGETFRRTAVTPTGCRATDIPGQEGPDGNAVQDFRVHSQSPHDTNPGGTKDNNNTILGVPRTQGQHTASVTTTRNGQAVRSPSGNQKASMNGPVIVKVRGNPVEESSEKQQDDESSSVSNTSHNWRSSSLTGLSSQSPPRGKDRGSVVSALMREDATIRSSSTTTRSVKKSTEHRVQLRRQGTNVITATPLSAPHAHSRLNSGWEGQKPEGTRQS